MTTAITDEKHTLAVRVGRPPAKDWPALKPEIEALIELQGYGLGKLARRYDVSVPGIRGVLRKLNLRTKGQPGQRS